MMRQLLPKTLFVRLLLIWIIGLAIIFSISFWLMANERSRIGHAARMESIAQRSASVLNALDALPDRAQRRRWAKRLRRSWLRLDFNPDPPPATAAGEPHPLPALHSALQEALQPRAFTLYKQSRPVRTRHKSRERGKKDRRESWFIHTHLEDGAAVRIRLPHLAESFHPRHSRSPSLQPFLLPLASLLLGIGLLSWIAVRLTIRPLSQFARAARALGEQPESAQAMPPLAASAPRELHDANTALRQMQSRIQSHLSERTSILAAISHDLKTPITRLRLRAELLDDEQLRGQILADLNAMQNLINEGLLYARSLHSNTQHSQEIDLDSLLAALCADAEELGWEVQAPTQACQTHCKGHADTLRRALWNLIENGVKYGQRVCLQCSCNAQTIQIQIRDFGSGLPAEKLEKVFQPFYRLEDSRNRDSGGTGLGLTIAHNIIGLHQGSIELQNHPEGGLVATVTLPAAGA